MILMAAMLAALPSATQPVPDPTVQTSGPRPNRDPDAIPDGRREEVAAAALSVNLSAVSDYRFRGVSQSDERPAAQASAEVASATGFYAGAWGSTTAAYDGADIEVDLYGGYRARVAGVDVDAGVITYFYPGADGVSSAEFYASGAREFGDATVKLGASYTPQQAELGDGDGLYLFAEAEKPIPRLPITVRGHVGREAGVNTATGARKFDWLLGADFQSGAATLSLAWVGARYQGRKDEEHHGDRAVAAVSLDF